MQDLTDRQTDRQTDRPIDGRTKFCCRVPLVVTETVDVGLLGEGIVPTVRHAWKELLRAKRSASPGKVIPSTATVYGCLIECEHVRRHSR
jgi:hypothetical protein